MSNNYAFSHEIVNENNKDGKVNYNQPPPYTLDKPLQVNPVNLKG